MSKEPLQRLERRLFSRLPLLGGWLRRQAVRALAHKRIPEATRLLAGAVAHSADPWVCAHALQTLRQVARAPNVDAVCEIWAATRHPQLAALLRAQGWVATAPPALQVLTALHAGQVPPAQPGGAEAVAPLLEACADRDPQLAQAATTALLQLQDPAAREALCQVGIAQEHPLARQIVLQAGYLPADAQQRAVFIFLTEQWERYEQLDYDRRLLRAAFAAAEPALRQRLLATLRRAGRLDYLPVILGGDLNSGAAAAPDEAEFAVQLLAAHQEWPRLWALVFQLPLAASVQALQALLRNGWRPPAGDDQQDLQDLARLATEELCLTSEALAQALPPAVRCAGARVRGRVNDLAFSADGRCLAIASGQGKLGIWDLQQAQLVETYDGFAHSLGRVTYTRGGALVCAERSRAETPCAITSWVDGQRACLGAYPTAVTALAAVDDFTVLVATRDRRIALWDLRTRASLAEQRLDDWPRALHVAPDSRQAVLLHDGLTLLRLPTLESVATIPANRWRGIAQCASFTPDGQGLLVGKANGEIVVCQWDGRRLKPERRRFLQHHGPLRAIEVWPKRGAVITAGAEGWVHWADWPSRAPLGRLHVAQERLTALRLAPDGNTMAIGDSDASFALWDLRPLEAPALLAQPLASMLPAHLPIVTLLAEAGLAPPAQRALQYIACILHHRFRYEIDVEELPVIRPGEYDIEL